MENIVKKEDLSDRNLALLKEYRLGSAEAGEQLAQLNSPLVYRIAQRFSERGEMSDLIECGNIGLVKGGVYLVHDTEGRRTNLHNRKVESNGNKALFAAG